MTAAILTIGDEILIGQVADTNSGFIAKALDKIGIRTLEMLSIGDDREQILNAFAGFQNRYDVVIMTGGLGPTKDDITKKTICTYFEDKLVVSESVLAHVTNLFENVLKVPITDVNRDQALVPSKAMVLHNAYGTAPGMWLQKDKTVFVSLPGVPFEMKGLIENEVVPRLIKTFDRPFIVHKTILTYGQGESTVAARIEQWENDLPSFVKLAYLPSPGRVRLRLTARGNDQARLEEAIAAQVKSLEMLIGEIIVGYDDGETIEAMLGKLLADEKLTISLAESCTGGKIAQTITAIPGSSQYFKGGVVSYSEEIKTQILGVNVGTIEKHTVVSAAVAREMAVGAQRIMQTDYAIAVTGNAGPKPDKTHEPVGVVFVALATPESRSNPEKVIVERFNFGQPREKVIDRTVVKSLEMLRSEILKTR